MSKSTSQHPKRRFVLPAVIGGGAASLLLALSMSPTVAAFTASISNNTNTAGSGTLIMQETSGSGSSAATCTSTDGVGGIGTNSATCSTINEYGGSAALVPGASVSTDVTITNTGSVPAKTFTLGAGACTQGNNGLVNGGATDLCSKITVNIVSSGKTIYNGTLAAFTTPVDVLNKLVTTSVDAGTSVKFTFTVTLDTSADNTYAGLQASQPLTWTFNS